MATVVQKTKVETNGVNPVPDNERYGKARDLFPIWFSWNVSIFGITSGIYVMGLGLSVWQTIVAGVLGYFLSCAIVGIIATGSVRTGLPTLVQSRFAFGYHGNKLPSFFGYAANMGWKVTLLSMASTTLADWFAKMFPALQDAAGHATQTTTLFSFAVVIIFTMIGAFYGHAMIMRIEKVIAWVTGLLTIVYLGYFLPEINFSALGSVPDAPIGTMIGGLVLAMTIVGLGFVNYGGDYARYLPRDTRSSGVIFWTTVGIALPVSILLVLGSMLSAGNPELYASVAKEPLVALLSFLPHWFYVIFSLVVIVSLMSAGMTGIYSSGLALLALGVPMSRLGTTILNAVMITLGSFYLTFISDSFLSTFTSFLATISVMMGSWATIAMVDLVRQKALGWDVKMALPPSEGGKSVRWEALGSFLFASFIGLGTITSSDPYIGMVTSFLLTEEMRSSVFASSNMGVILAMLVAMVVYAFITFVCKRK